MKGSATACRLPRRRREALTFEWKTIESGSIRRATHDPRPARRHDPRLLRPHRGGESNRYHESAVGFPLGRGVFASVEFWSRGNALRCTVRGRPVAEWHREQARRAVGNVALDGNLPPARVTARARAGRFTGAVTDRFGHADVGITVRLERRIGKRCRTQPPSSAVSASPRACKAERTRGRSAASGPADSASHRSFSVSP
jgi:hypothetical protein